MWWVHALATVYLGVGILYGYAAFLWHTQRPGSGDPIGKALFAAAIWPATPFIIWYGRAAGKLSVPAKK